VIVTLESQYMYKNQNELDFDFVCLSRLVANCQYVYQRPPEGICFKNRTLASSIKFSPQLR
jgi:hypothetical protein